MPGDMYTVHVGAAGTAGNAGEASYFNTNSLVDVASVVAAGGGGTTYGYGYMIVSEAPSMAIGQPNKVTCALSLIGRSISY